MVGVGNCQPRWRFPGSRQLTVRLARARLPDVVRLLLADFEAERRSPSWIAYLVHHVTSREADVPSRPATQPPSTLWHVTCRGSSTHSPNHPHTTRSRPALAKRVSASPEVRVPHNRLTAFREPVWDGTQMAWTSVGPMHSDAQTSGELIGKRWRAAL
ncbi:LADA_0E10726g1_1 [Lachancea dasiensis]|uniref:LADA_0E10726g1_1 n=1 Tax=Lachancea dasiensis TaxID=1072105 RepID=A0A1G4JE82_9SACH|nr:LADA_0E10726g1_1 [Lachancea dasiensis]